MSQFGLVRRAIAAPKSAVFQVVAALGAVVLSAGLRWLVDRGANGAPFVGFVPIVMLAAIFLEWRYAVLAALASVVVVVELFGSIVRMQITVQNSILWISFAFIATFMIVAGHILRQTILELDAQTRRIHSFNSELQHRIKNTLQVVRALASRARHTTDPREFYDTLTGRLDALVKANELLGPSTFRACDVADLVREAMLPFPPGAIEALGPACEMAGDSAKLLMMVLHELGTNAVKYGALSCDAGRVAITWTPAADAIDFVWKESGGPPVAPPTSRGLGSRMLSPERALTACALDFRPEGVVCRLTIATAHGNLGAA